MFDYQHELQRRIDQFTFYLKKMQGRTNEVCINCFMSFSEESPHDESSDTDELSEEVVPALELSLALSGDSGLNDQSLNDDPNLFSNIPDDFWRQDESQKRFIQFSFREHCFCVDMPYQTLYRAEAQQILRSRTGFFYLQDRPEFLFKGDIDQGCDPFRKFYVYGDEDSAAEDMAFVWFNVWKFPVDTRLYVTAAAFGDKPTNWERGESIE